jgi:hypothetical protein
VNERGVDEIENDTFDLIEREREKEQATKVAEKMKMKFFLSHADGGSFFSSPLSHFFFHKVCFMSLAHTPLISLACVCLRCNINFTFFRVRASERRYQLQDNRRNEKQTHISLNQTTRCATRWNSGDENANAIHRKLLNFR